MKFSPDITIFLYLEFVELIISHHEAVEVLVVPEEYATRGGTSGGPISIGLPAKLVSKQRITVHKEDKLDKGKVEALVRNILSQPREDHFYLFSSPTTIASLREHQRHENIPKATVEAKEPVLLKKTWRQTGVDLTSREVSYQYIKLVLILAIIFWQDWTNLKKELTTHEILEESGIDYINVLLVGQIGK